MKTIMYSLTVAALAFCLGCSDSGDYPSQPKTPTVAEYKALLEMRAASVDGANINIMKEVSKFESASDSEKRDLYKKVASLVK